MPAPLADEVGVHVSAEEDSFFMELDTPGAPGGVDIPIGIGDGKLAVPTLAVLDQLPALVMAMDLDQGMQIVFWNRECEALSGYTAGEMVRQDQALERLYPDPAYRARKLADCRDMAPQFRNLEWTLTTRSGEKRRVGWSTISGVNSGSGRREVWCIGLDVTARSESDRLVRARDKLLTSVFRHLPDMVYLKDGQGHWLLTNPAARAAYGLSEREAVGLSDLDLAERKHPLADALRQSALAEEASWQSGRPSRTEEVADDVRGQSRHYDVVRVPAFGRQGQRLHMLVVRRDITDQRIAATKLELAGRVLEQSTDGIMIFEADRRVIMVNAAFSDITGYGPDEVIGQTSDFLASGLHDSEFFRAMWQALDGTGHWRGEVWSRRKNGEVYPQWLALSTLRHRTTGEITHYVASFSDLSSRKAAEEKIAYLSTQDAITGLPNRAQVSMRGAIAINHAKATNEALALMVIDIDNFKMLNDSLSHAAGDQLLREVGRRLAANLGERGMVGRLSGDEFLVLIPGVIGTSGAAHTAQSLMAAVAAPIALGEMNMSVSISLGIAMCPGDGDTFDLLFARADAALHAAKRGGRAAYQFASASMNAAALERLQIESALRRAIESRAMHLDYQPLIDLATGQIVGCEALCRWTDAQRGAVSPGVFIPVAEDSGMIETLGAWVIKTAVHQLRVWHDSGYPHLVMAINLSARQFQRGVVLRQVEEALMETGVAAEKIELELTESVLLHDAESVMNTLHRLKALGVSLSIDDFGTGYSSFAYLRRFKFDKIKIDQSFVRDMIDDPEDAAIVRGMISLAASLGLKVLAEGVETEALAQRLRHFQCHFAQGYHFDRPLRPEEFVKRLGSAAPPVV